MPPFWRALRDYRLQNLSAGSHLQRTIWTTGLSKRLKENNQQDIEETWRLSWEELIPVKDVCMPCRTA